MATAMRLWRRLRAGRAAISEAMTRIREKKRQDAEDLRLIAELNRELAGERSRAEAVRETADQTQERLREAWEARGVFAQSAWGQRTQLRQKALAFMRLYNEALAALVEGQRQVLHNDDFVFDDGESVKAKEERFRAFIQSAGKSAAP